MSDVPTRSVRIIRMNGLTIKSGRSESSLYEIMNPRSRYYDSTFPKRYQLGPRTVGWLEHEVDAWLLSRKSTTLNSISNEHIGGAK